MKKNVLLLNLVLSNLLFAADPVVFGAWNLKEFTVFKSNEDTGVPFCSNFSGQILYEESGHMSVSINCGKSLSENEPADEFGRVYFYSADFKTVEENVNGKVIKTLVHKITNATNLKIIGKDQFRKIEEITNDKLVLTGPFGSGSLKITWEKLPKYPHAATATQKTNDVFAMLTILKVKPGTEDAFKKEVAHIVEPTLAEPDNIAWYVQQSETDSTEFLFYTRWPNNDALKKHLESPELKKYLENTNGMLEPGHLQLVRYLPIDGQHKTRKQMGLLE